MEYNKGEIKMSTDPKKVVEPTVEPTNPIVTDPAPADPKQTDPKPEDKKFTQEEVNKIVVARIERERETFAKTFGLAAFNKETIDVIAKEYPTLKSEKETLANKEAEAAQEILKRDKLILGYEAGINRDKIDEAITLAELRIAKDSTLDLTKALAAVVAEYPSLAGPKGKAGILPGDNTTPPANPYLTPEILKKYPHLAKKAKK